MTPSPTTTHYDGNKQVGVRARVVAEEFFLGFLKQ